MTEHAEASRVGEVLSISDVFALFDPRNGEWMIGRSHPGLRSFYYSVSSNDDIQFAASTQLRALLPMLQSRPTVDHLAISRYLCNGFFSDPDTPFKELRSLLPREVLRTRHSTRTWVPIPDTQADAPGYTPVQQQQSESPTQRVRRLLVEAVAVQTTDGNEAACMLSGGVDSSTVAAIAARLLGKQVHTFSLVFEDESLSEAKYASAVARRIGSKHHNVLLKQTDFEASLDWLLGALDVPTTDALNSLLICRSLAEAGHPAALAGVGSDELFGGHECMRRVPRAMTLLHHYRRCPRFARTAIQQLAAVLLGCTKEHWLPSHGLRGKFMALLDQELDPLAVYLLSRRVLLPEAVARLKPAILESYSSVPVRTSAAHHDAPRRDVLLKTISQYEQEIYLRNQLLRDLSMVSVASGVDVRVPFLDRALIAAVGSLPASQLFLSGRPKRFLIECVSDILPVEAYDRPKLGFVLPIGQWLGGIISARLHRFTAQGELLDILGLDQKALELIIADCSTARGRIFYTREWCAFVLLDWFSRHLRN
jgi:asparagine synthase (glutamine-hydrolysing)